MLGYVPHTDLNRTVSLVLFKIYLTDNMMISDVSEVVGGAFMVTPNFHVSLLLYADDLCLTAYSPTNLYTMRHRLKLTLAGNL
eukprot:scaffold190959_cov14-Tisochrysis_lutea.AAC.1